MAMENNPTAVERARSRIMLASCALGMTTCRNAGHRAIRVTRLTLMDLVRAGLVVVRLRVAIDAGNAGVTRLVNMAIRAHRAMVGQLPVGSVVEDHSQPARGVVAAGSGAIRREAGGDVIGYGAA